MNGVKGKARVLNKQEFDRLLLITESGRYVERNIAILYFSFYLGLRVKEISSLTLGDVLDAQGMIKEQINLAGRKKTKGDYFREIFLTNKKVKVALKNYLKIRLNHIERMPSSALFLSQASSRFTPNTLQQLFKRLYLRAGIEGASSHSGRRTFCTRLIESGVDIKAVSRLMGHNSIQITARYIEDNPERLRKIAENISL